LEESRNKNNENLVKIRSAVKKIKEYTPGRNPEEVQREFKLGKVIKLASNENPFGPSPKVLDVIKNFKHFNVYPDPDPADLREKIAEYTDSSPEKIVIGAGIDGILDSIFKLMIDAGDEVIIPIPTFLYYHTLASIYDAKQIIVERDRNFEISVEEIINKKSSRTKIIFICSPNNPTGNVEKYKKVKEIVEEFRKSLIFIDEAYFEFSGKTLTDLTSYDNVVVARTFSKAFGLANLRIGYAIMDKNLRRQFLKVNPPFSVSSIAKIAALKALDDLDYLKWVVNEIKLERDKIIKKINKISLFKAYESHANFVFVRSKLKSKIVVNELLKRGIIIRDCSNFPGCSEYDIRVSVGKKDENELFLKNLIQISKYYEKCPKL